MRQCHLHPWIQAHHRVEPDASSVSNLGVGGFTSAGARSAGTLGAVTIRPSDMQRPMRTHLSTPSSAASSQAKIGSGTIAATNTSMVRLSRLRGIIPSINRFRDQPAAFRLTGRTSWPDGDHDEP